MEVEKPFHISSVMLIDPKEKKPTRVGYKFVTEKKKNEEITKKVRYAKKSGEILD